MNRTTLDTPALGEAEQRQLLAVRIVTAVIQGLTLYYLSLGGGSKSWTLAQQQINIPLHLIAVWVPWIIYLGVGQMRARWLVMWAVAAALILAAIGYHQAARETYVPPYTLLGPRGPLWIALAVGVFMAQVLVVDAAAERRLMPSYERHFDTAWTFGLRCILSSLFIGIFWLLLYLGARLFLLIKLSFLDELIKEPLFGYPALAIMTAVAFHVTDTQVSVIRGLRTVVLTLFSWLLPLLVAIVLSFLVVLLFVPIDRLWSTRFAASLLLWTSVALILLINASYQDVARSRLKSLSVSMASLEVMPVVVLAGWAIGLRVAQHGWTTDRIFAAAVAGVVFCYAAGYVLALAGRSAWRRWFETTNVVTAYVILAVILALFSPLADPGRLMVASQMARLKSGAVDATSFDFKALLRDGARWGKVALEELSQSKDITDAEKVNESARGALAGRAMPGQIRGYPWAKLTPEMVEVSPLGRTLPESFFSPDQGAFRKANPGCAQPQSKKKCRATFVSPNDGRPEAVLFYDTWSARLYEQNADGRWEGTGTLQGRTHCKSVREAMETSAFTLDPHPWPDLLVGGERLTIVPAQQGPC